MAEPIGKSETELAIETFVDRMMDIHSDLDRQEFHDKISGCVQEATTAAEDGEGEEESDSEEE